MFVACCNAVIDPLVYAFRNREFYKALLFNFRFFTTRLKRRRRPRTSSTATATAHHVNASMNQIVIATAAAAAQTQTTTNTSACEEVSSCVAANSTRHQRSLLVNQTIDK